MFKHPITTFEMIDIPDNKTGQLLEQQQATQLEYWLGDDTFAEVHITEHSTPNWFDDSIVPSTRAHWQEDSWKPGTLSAFLRTQWPQDGLLRMTFYPRKVVQPQHNAVAVSTSAGRPLEKPKHIWRYDLAWTSPVRFITAHVNCKYTILAGSRRTLLYTVPWDSMSSTPEIQAFHRYHDAELEAQEPEMVNGELVVDEAPRYPIQRLPFLFPPGQRFESICWDETIGRVCFVAPQDTRVLVLDFAKRPREG